MGTCKGGYRGLVGGGGTGSGVTAGRSVMCYRNTHKKKKIINVEKLFVNILEIS